MALSPRLSNAAASLAADAVCAQLDDGYLRIYDGTQPATADTAISSQTLLAELRFGNPAYESAIQGLATPYDFTADPSANATGTASWFRALKSDGTTAVFDGSVGTSGANLNLNTTSIEAGAEVSVSNLNYTQQKT
jgi:hypothetical protein